MAAEISSCSPLKAEFILFKYNNNKSGIYIKAQEQIIQNIQKWFPVKSIRGGKDHIQENVNGKHLKEGRMIRNCSNTTDLQHMFYSTMHGNQTFSMTNSC